MRNREKKFLALAAATAGILPLLSTRLDAAAVSWNGSASDLWSNAANWTGGLPAANDVTFNAADAAATAGVVTNEVDADTTVNSLFYTQRADLNLYHTTQIDSGVTLSINSTGGTALFVGYTPTGAEVAKVDTRFTGLGTLAVNNPTGNILIRQTATTNGTQNATLDLSGLSTFTANVDSLQVGTSTSTTSGLNRAGGTLKLAANNTINANTILISENPNSASGPAAQLYLGNVNVLNAATITVGGRKGNNAVMGYRAGVTGGTLVIRGAGGVGRSNLNLGLQPSPTGSPDSTSTGTMDLSSTSGIGSGSIDAQIGTLYLGRSGNNSTFRGIGTLTYDSGIVDANDAVVGDDNNTTGTGFGSGALIVKGSGKLLVNNSMTLAKRTGTTGGSFGSLTVSGATASARVTAPILDSGGTTTVVVSAGGSLQARGLGTAASPIDNATVDNATLIVDLGAGGIPASAWGNVATLTANNTNKIGLQYSGVLTTGTFKAIDYGTIAGAGFSSFSLAKLPARVTAALVDNTGAGSIDINVTSADSPKWTGANNGNWNIAGDTNWKLINALTTTNYQEDLVTYSTTDTVLFDDSATGTTTVNLTTTLSPNAITVNNSALPYTFGGTGKVSGATGILKQGSGTLTIANTGGNDFTGPVDLQAGTLAVGADEVLPNAAQLTVPTGATFDLSSHSETISQLNLTGGVVTGTSGSVVAPVAAQSGVISAAIAGVSGVMKTGSGLVTLSGANTYSGATTITTGTLRISNSSALGSAAGNTNIAGGAATSDLELIGNISSAEPIVLSGRTGGGTPNNTPHLVNASDNNAITAPISLETGGSVYTFQSNGGKLTLGGLVNNTGTTGSRTVNLFGTGAGEITGAVANGTGTGPITLVKDGAGAWTLSASDTIAGPTSVKAGRLSFAAPLTKLASLDVLPGAVARIDPDSTRVLGVAALTTTSKLDITNNKVITPLVVGTWNGSNYSDITGMIQTGRNAGGWGGASGIVTSQTQATTSNLTSIGVASASQVKGVAATATATWAGQTVTGTDTLVMYTYGGDANLDGRINVDDYTRIDFNVPLGTNGWYNGDFNYDGKINVDDYTIIDFNVGIQGAPFSAASAPLSGGLTGVSAVPEPRTAGLLLAFYAQSLVWRRRRRGSIH